ncbi:MAG: hypothetical protein JO076_14330 [Verrucomicrobia bacterium]|nr:hypothetical protein [Verrucomicrobiota bacterium]
MSLGTRNFTDVVSNRIKVWGVGHASLVAQDEAGLIFYHAKTPAIVA